MLRRRRTIRTAPPIDEASVAIAVVGVTVVDEPQTATTEETRAVGAEMTTGRGGLRLLVEAMPTGVTVVISRPSTAVHAAGPDRDPLSAMADQAKTSIGTGALVLSAMDIRTAIISISHGGTATRSRTSSYSCFRKWNVTLSLGSSVHSSIAA